MTPAQNVTAASCKNVAVSPADSAESEPKMTTGRDSCASGLAFVMRYIQHT